MSAETPRPVRTLNNRTQYPSNVPQSRMPALARAAISTHSLSLIPPPHLLHLPELELQNNLQTKLIHSSTKRTNDSSAQRAGHVAVSTIPSGLFVDPAGLGRYPDITHLPAAAPMQPHGHVTAAPSTARPAGRIPGPVNPHAPPPSAASSVHVGLKMSITHKSGNPTVDYATRGEYIHPTHGITASLVAAEPGQSLSRNQGLSNLTLISRHHRREPARDPKSSRTSFPGPLRRSSSLRRGRPRPPLSNPPQHAFRGPPVLCRSNTRAQGRIVKLVSFEPTRSTASLASSPSASLLSFSGDADSADRSSSVPVSPIARVLESMSYFKSEPRSFGLNVRPSGPASYLITYRPTSTEENLRNNLPTDRRVDYASSSVPMEATTRCVPDKARETWKRLAELGMAPTPLMDLPMTDTSSDDDDGGDGDEHEREHELYLHEVEEVLDMKSRSPSEAHLMRLQRLWSPRTLESNWMGQKMSVAPLHPDLRHVLSAFRSA